MVDIAKRVNTPNQNILANVDRFVREEIAKSNVPSDTKLAWVATVDNNGAKILVAAQIVNTEKVNIKIASVFEHEWSGDNTAGFHFLGFLK